MPEIRHWVHINPPSPTVYRAITDQAGLQGWWTQETVAVPEIGSIAKFRFGARYHNKISVTRLEPDRIVVWECLDGDAEWIGTRFTFELEAGGDHTILRFTHGDWREATDFMASCNYHWGYYMHSLKAYCETGVGTPFQADG